MTSESARALRGARDLDLSVAQSEGPGVAAPVPRHFVNLPFTLEFLLGGSSASLRLQA